MRIARAGQVRFYLVFPRVLGSYQRFSENRFRDFHPVGVLEGLPKVVVYFDCVAGHQGLL